VCVEVVCVWCVQVCVCVCAVWCEGAVCVCVGQVRRANVGNRAQCGKGGHKEAGHVGGGKGRACSTGKVWVCVGGVAGGV